MAGRRKTVNRSDPLRCQLSKEFAEARAFSSHEGNISGSDLAEIEHVRLNFFKFRHSI